MCSSYIAPTSYKASFEEALIQSRFYRVQALLNLLKKCGAAAANSLDSSAAAASAALDLSSKGSQYVQLVAKENQKIVLEAYVKSSAGRGDRASFEKCVTEYVNVDPMDPVVWHTISTRAAKCGWKSTARVANAGLMYLGGNSLPDRLRPTSDRIEGRFDPITDLDAFLLKGIDFLRTELEHYVSRHQYYER